MKVYALRGAITLSEDSPQEMERAVSLLMAELVQRNALRPHRIVEVVFSQTTDLRSANPATALRKSGFAVPPLFCVQEPTYPDSLPQTLRILLLCKAPLFSRAYWRPPVHCYLDGAATLRPDLSGSRKEISE